PSLLYRRFPNLRRARLARGSRVCFARVAGLTIFNSSWLYQRPADSEIGDTAGSETCATPERPLASVYEIFPLFHPAPDFRQRAFRGRPAAGTAGDAAFAGQRISRSG